MGNIENFNYLTRKNAIVDYSRKNAIVEYQRKNAIVEVPPTKNAIVEYLDRTL